MIFRILLLSCFVDFVLSCIEFTAAATVWLYVRILTAVTSSTSLADGVARDVEPAKAVMKAEKEQLARYKLPLAAFIHDSVALQVQAVYAVQVYCHSNGFPKGTCMSPSL